MNSRAALGRRLVMPVVSLTAYFVARPLLHSDAVALAVAGFVPATYLMVRAIRHRKLDLLAAKFTVGLAVGCVAALLAGGNSLPLKLHDATVTFVVGVVLLVAVLIGRPLPVGRLLKAPRRDSATDRLLGSVAGGFLILHALLHLLLALKLSSADYLVGGRIVNVAPLVVGGLGLSYYARRQPRSNPDDRAPVARPGTS